MKIASQLSPPLVNSVIALDQQALATLAWSAEQWRTSFQTPHTYWFRACCDEGTLEPVGFVLVDPLPFEDVAHLLKIAVHPSYRRQGIAQSLLAELEREFMPTKRALLWEVASDNQMAIAFYLRWGARTLHRQADYYSDGRDCIKMLKDFNIVN